VAALATAALTACGHGAVRPADLGVAPPIEMPAVLDGAPAVSLAALRGRPVIVNFWSSSCVPCRTETPALEAAHRAAAGRVAFLGVDEEDLRGDAQDAVRRWGATYPSAYDRAGVLADSYRLRGLPTTMLVAADGHIRSRHTGALSRTAIDRLVREAAA
jgi:thiol-disulfide isomerase/thioredoxin